MPFYPAPGVAQLVMAGMYGGAEQLISVIHVQRKNDGFGEPWTQPQLRDAALRLSLGWQRWLTRLTNAVAWNEVRSRDLTIENGAVDLLGINLVGTSVGIHTTPQVTYLIQWRTGTAGRGANGRTYLAGPAEADVDGMGRVLVGRVGDLSAAAQGILTDLGGPTSAILPGSPLDMVVLHGPKGAPQSRTGTPVLLGRASGLVATQRRRLPKRG
jgi:hypothetical protein